MPDCPKAGDVEPIVPSEEDIDEAIDESFPASDASQWWAGRATRQE
ncbi:MAG TPA: hypothetical protein VED63_11250 [Acidimicrobiales bacterium]|nr:hypothetical protein [Acidimicrobiales bacterium]